MNDGAAVSLPPEHSPLVCWTCGKTADTDSPHRVALECYGKIPDALGYEINVTKSETVVVVPIPRCRACHTWFKFDFLRTLLCIFAGIFTPGITLVVYSRLTGVALPSDMFDGSANIGPLLVFFGCIVLSCAAWWFGGIALLSYALGHWPVRSRTEKNFPPIVALRLLGWKWPKSSAD